MGSFMTANCCDLRTILGRGSYLPFSPLPEFHTRESICGMASHFTQILLTSIVRRMVVVVSGSTRRLKLRRPVVQEQGVSIWNLLYSAGSLVIRDSKILLK